MKAIMLSIKPKHVFNILLKRKIYEIRSREPNCDLPIPVFIYCTNDRKGSYITQKGRGKVVAKFILRKVEEFTNDELWEGGDRIEQLVKNSCVSFPEIMAYSRASSIRVWHIEDLTILHQPKELKDFGLERAPQSYCFVESEE